MNEEIQAKITGIISLNEHLDKDSSYSIALEQCCVKRIDTRQLAEDDKHVTIYSLENLGRVNILTEKEKKPHLIKAKSKKVTQSQVLRLEIESAGFEYEKFMANNVLNSKWKKLI